MAYFDTVIPGTAQGYWYTFFKNNIPNVSGWDIWDDISASYQIVFRCQHPNYGTFYLEINDLNDTAKLYFRIWEEWDNVNHIGNTSKGYTSQAYIRRTSGGQSIRLYVNNQRIIVGDRTNGHGYYGGFLDKISSLDVPYIISIGLSSTLGNYNPLATPYAGMVWSLAKNHLGSLAVAVRADFCYYDTPQALHKVTPAGYAIITPTFVTENTTTSSGKTFGILNGVSSQGGRVAFENGDIAYDSENNPWDAYMISATYRLGCLIKRE